MISINNEQSDNKGVPTAIKLKDIYIGDIDGDKEAGKDNFMQLFYNKNNIAEDIINTDKFIISGRKGTGKTFLANYLMSHLVNNNHLCSLYRLEDFQKRKLIDLQYQELKDNELSLFWRWIFLIQMAENITQSSTWRSKNPLSAERKLRKFLIEKNPEGFFKEDNRTTTKHAKLNFTGKSKRTLSNEIDFQKTTHYIRTHYFNHIDELERLLINYISQKRSNGITLIYDDLDELENRMAYNVEYSRLIIKMLETVRNLNFTLCKHNRHCRVVALLRIDILDGLHKYSSNTNKWITANSVNLVWFSQGESHPCEHPLMDMILKKIKNSVDEYKNLDEKNLYDIIFPHNINNTNPLNHLLNYSYGRPRDIVRYLNIMKERFPNDTAFLANHFKTCSQEYSAWFYRELENEISIHERKNMISESIELIVRFAKSQFTFEELEVFFIEHQSTYPDITSLKEAINLLYELGVLGNFWKVGRKRKPHYSWSYSEGSLTKIDFSKSFTVHYGLRNQFNM